MLRPPDVEAELWWETPTHGFPVLRPTHLIGVFHQYLDRICNDLNGSLGWRMICEHQTLMMWFRFMKYQSQILAVQGLNDVEWCWMDLDVHQPSAIAGQWGKLFRHTWPWIRGREELDPSLAEMLQQSGGTESTKWSDNPYKWPKINGFHCFFFHPKRWSYMGPHL